MFENLKSKNTIASTFIKCYCGISSETKKTHYENKF